MFKNEVDAVSAAAESKVAFLKRTPAGYLAASMLAGAFVAFGGFVSVSINAALSGSAYAKIISAFAFSSALSLVVMAGSELFTGNNMVMGIGVLTRRVAMVDALKLWLVCWLGNYAGAWIAVGLYRLTGLVTGDVAAAFASTARAKLSLTPVQMFVRGVLCNMLVCLAVWCGLKLKSESGKLIMIFWCIFVFMICGFEHSVANMSTIGVALTVHAAGFWEYVLNVGVVTMGNIVGGVVLVALPYYISARKG